jgi:hypothetical protein
MDVKDRIYVARRPRLGLDRPNYRVRHLSYAVTACVVISALIWLAMR